MTECDEAYCQRPGIKRGYCNTHYERRRRSGEFEIAHGPRDAQFWSHVEKTETCWLWRGVVNSSGYGRTSWFGRQLQAHRVAYELAVGPIPPGLHLDHLCRVRNCVNPEHLEPVTVGENLLRGETVTARNATRTHCPSGHPYSEDNTYSHNGARQCLTCRTEISRKRAARAKLARAARRSDTEDALCRICTETFQRPAGDGRRVICSDDCRREAQREAVRKYDATRA